MANNEASSFNERLIPRGENRENLWDNNDIDAIGSSAQPPILLGLKNKGKLLFSTSNVVS